MFLLYVISHGGDSGSASKNTEINFAFEFIFYLGVGPFHKDVLNSGGAICNFSCYTYIGVRVNIMYIYNYIDF